MKPRISACLITKNEEKLIEKCIRNLIPVVYEIIILDTGSTDKTLEICQNVGAYVWGEASPSPTTPLHIYETKWENDFSKARNESISYAAGDWILILDPDEILSEETPEKLLLFLENKGSEPFVYNFKIINLFPEQNLSFPVNIIMKGVLFRNGLGIKYFNPIHEKLGHDEKELKFIDCPELVIYHMQNLRGEEEIRKKNLNYRDILENRIKNISDNPEKYFLYFYLGITYVQLNEFEKAVESYYKMVCNLFNYWNFPENWEIYDKTLQKIIVEKIFNQKNKPDAETYLNEIFFINNNSPLELNYTANGYSLSGNFEKAMYYYQMLLHLIKNDSFDEVNISSILCEIGRCYINLGHKELGLQYLNKVFYFNPKFPKCLLFLEKFFLLGGDLKKTLFYHLKNDFGYSQDEAKFLEGFSKSDSSSAGYKKILSGLLLKIIQLEGWAKKEKDEMEAFLKQLS